MPITATSPQVIPAQPEQTFPYWWITGLWIDGVDPHNVKVRCTLQRYTIDEYGAVVFYSGPEQSFAIEDVVNSSDPNIQAVVGTLVTAIQNYGQAHGLI